MPMLGGLAAFLAIMVFVTAHEAGHFIAAKSLGMKATEFFFGFGPRLWSFKRGETEYGIKLFPLGGYVRIIGMSPIEEVPEEDLHRTYRGKPFWMKSVVVLAGVAMNFAIAFVMFAGIDMYQGRIVPTTTIDAVVPRLDSGVASPAALGGLQPGDRIVAIDGEPTPDWESVVFALRSRPDRVVEITVERGGATVTVTTTLASTVDPASGQTIGQLGIRPDTVRRAVGPATAIVTAGRQIGDTVTATLGVFGRLIEPRSLERLAGGLVGQPVPDNIRPVSPFGIAQIGAQVDRIGVINVLALLAYVNVILGTLNVLPLYPLDGGHFAVALWEKVTGRRADMRVLVPIAAAVVAFMVFLGLVAFVLDILHPINL